MPFGRPVEPEEYIQNAMSLRCVSAQASRSEKDASQASAFLTLTPRSFPLGSPLTPRSFPLGSPLTTMSVFNGELPPQAISKRSQNSASTTAVCAPESSR
jgi:hypothetical protein